MVYHQPIRKPKPKPRQVVNVGSAFNLRLPPPVVEQLDRIARDGPVELSRNQLIQRVLVYFVEAYAVEERAHEGGEAGSALMHHIAGFFDYSKKGAEDDKR